MAKNKQIAVPAAKQASARSLSRKKARLIAGARRVRVKFADAMRFLGLDETKLAGKFNGLVDRLSRRRSRSEKLLLEVLKECCKLLESTCRVTSARRLG